MGGEPDRQGGQGGPGHDALDAWFGQADLQLVETDPETGHHHLPAHDLAIAPEGEEMPVDLQARFGEAAQHQLAAVIADYVMIEEILQLGWHATPGDIIRRREHGEL
ncbi:hypothetical protein [uncultured Maricaulis sp.]|uniref:hypothetical protein n=1 Tax=uncultured Maricaulis sp. TaxID=174710 RepID=UPI0030DA29F8